ncbi:MAG: 3-dehydroquinate synthase II [Candidatus Hecatellales archaeon]|nr:MAG: 3-dehydroquinate synthase II [Candidatus Hecatellales archaeon]
MKELWVEIDKSLPENLKQKILENCKGNCNVVVGEDDFLKLAKNLNLKTASKTGGDIRLVEELNEELIKRLIGSGEKVCVKLTVKDRGDEEKIVGLAEMGVSYVIAQCQNWKIIPLENLIAKIRGKTKLLTEVSNVEEAKLALEILELGVDGVVLKTDKPETVKEVSSTIASLREKPKLKLAQAKILRCKEIGLGDRACIDTCSLMVEGEGILVGCQSSGLFLVQAEVLETPHVEPRPFRVNAGPVSLYVLASKDKTRYLSELKAGEEVLIVDRDGNLRSSIVGRVKIERRPLLLIEAEEGGETIKTIVQNAETIHLVTKDGSKSVRELKPGDEVLVYRQRGGRHFGILVEEETVIEK